MADQNDLDIEQQINEALRERLGLQERVEEIENRHIEQQKELINAQKELADRATSSIERNERLKKIRE